VTEVVHIHRTLEQELFALARGASLECLVCGEFVLRRGEALACPECGSVLRGEGDAAVSQLEFDMQAG
jgi:Zn finger protein HypA/HybF involved in hydrogenase expression